jgi:hypothetical protein
MHQMRAVADLDVALVGRSGLKRFGISLVHRDGYGAEILAERFCVAYAHFDKSKGDLYLELLPVLYSNQARNALERPTWRSRDRL